MSNPRHLNAEAQRKPTRVKSVAPVRNYRICQRMFASIECGSAQRSTEEISINYRRQHASVPAWRGNNLH